MFDPSMIDCSQVPDRDPNEDETVFLFVARRTDPPGDDRLAPNAGELGAAVAAAQANFKAALEALDPNMQIYEVIHTTDVETYGNEPPAEEPAP